LVVTASVVDAVVVLSDVVVDDVDVVSDVWLVVVSETPGPRMVVPRRTCSTCGSSTSLLPSIASGSAKDVVVEDEVRLDLVVVAVLVVNEDEAEGDVEVFLAVVEAVVVVVD
jgi:hypothetical protein